MTQSYIPIFIIIPPWKKMWPFISLYFSSLYQVVLEKKIFKSRQCIFSMWLLCSLEKNAWPLIWKKKEFPLPKNTLCHVCWNWPSGSGEDFQKLSIFFQFLLLSPLRKRAMSLIWKKLNTFNPRMFYAKFG